MRKVLLSLPLAMAFFAAGCSELPLSEDMPAAYALDSWETVTNGDLSPTSTLSPLEAARLAHAIRTSVPRDIILSGVQPTGSMRPYFDDNAMLLLEAAPFSALKVGDVVTYWHPELRTVVVHRLLEKRGDVFWARGDHNRHMDTVYVTAQNYRRRLVGVIYLARGGPANGRETVSGKAERPKA